MFGVPDLIRRDVYVDHGPTVFAGPHAGRQRHAVTGIEVGMGHVQMQQGGVGGTGRDGQPMVGRRPGVWGGVWFRLRGCHQRPRSFDVRQLRQC
jgi:hypothetical protein